MAELALGMTKTVVEGALSRIQAAMEEEKKLKDSVQQDLVFITGEFQMMQSFLKVANKERARKNEVVRTWIRQLRDLAFDVEDWVEFVTHMDPRDESSTSSLWRAVPSWAVPRCLAPPQHLDEAAAEMKMLKARVEDVSHRNTRYNIFNNDDGSSPPGSGFGSAGLDYKNAAAADNLSHRHRAFEILSQLWQHELGRSRKVAGGGGLKDLLIVPDVVGGDADLQVIWLWGGDDRGMSKLINKAYHDPETSKWFNHRAWVRITFPFKQEEFSKTLQDQLVLTNNCSSNMQPAAEMTDDEKRYLIVVEHVSDLVEWNTIRMCLPAPVRNKGSRIVVSTQHLGLPIYDAPYLVSQLVTYVDGRRPPICAFYKKIAARCCDTDGAQLKEKIKLGTIISVCGVGPRKSRLVKSLYNQIWMNSGYFGVLKKFELIRWVPVVGGQQQETPLNLLDLSRRMILASDYYGFYDGDLHELLDIFGGSELRRVLHMAEEEVIQESREDLKRHKSLVIIHGLRSTDDWDVIKSKFLLPLPKFARRYCFVVVTDDPVVASYCVDGNEEQLVHVRHTDMGMSQGRISPYKREEAIASMTSIYDRHNLTSNRRQEQYDKLISDYIVTEGDTLHVVSVFGMAGVGKSAMVKWFYSKKLLDPENTRCDFNNYCWVEVPHPFSLEGLSWRLLLELFVDHAEHREAAMTNIIEERRDIIQECQVWLLKLTTGPSLLVLDGVRSMEDWDAVNAAFCLSDPTYQNYTVVITDQQTVAMHCVNNNAQKVVNIHCLEADDALRLFHRQIGFDNMDASEGKDDVRALELSKSIMAKCGGLPKVIAAIAECYNKSLTKGIYLKLKDINDNFMQILEGAHSLSGLFSWMQSYLETCKDDIKPCIFYLPVFLVGRNVRLRRLLRRWTAEGYLRDTASLIAEWNGRKVLIELMQSGMIQIQQSTEPGQLQVNGFFHEYITTRPLEDNLVFALEGPCSLNTSQRAGPSAHHLTVRNISDTDRATFRSVDFSRLRSLTVFGECKPFMFEIQMRFVRVLDLEDAVGVENGHLEHVVEVFPRLKFLSLRGCREITSLPKSLGHLRQLQTLDVRNTSIASLPEAILELHKLQYVRGGTGRSNPWHEGGSMVVPCKPPTTTLVEEGPITTTVAADHDSATTVAAASPLAPAQSPTTSSEEEDPLSKAAATTMVSPAPAQDYSSTATTCSCWPHALTTIQPSCLSKLCCRSRIIDDSSVSSSPPGVEVPAGIGKLTTLQTLGVANVGTGGGGKAVVILKELPKLTELRRLAVCGVNQDNIHGFFSAITGLPHLMQLSVRLDKNSKDGHFACLDHTVKQPPESLAGRIKLHGHVRILAGSWIKEFAATVVVLDLEVTLQQEEDMQVILDQLLHHKNVLCRSRLCLKPVYDGNLSIGVIDEERQPRPTIELQLNVLEIVCTTKLQASIVGSMPYVDVVKVHCSSGSSLQLSGLQKIHNLNEVWLKGSFRDDSLKQDLQRQLAQHQNIPVLKVFQPLTD